jgi:hypothetical protein
MTFLALTFKAHQTARLEEIVGALAAIAGVAFFFGGITPMGRRIGLIFGGIALAASGVVFVLAVRYGVRPR